MHVFLVFVFCMHVFLFLCFAFLVITVFGISCCCFSSDNSEYKFLDFVYLSQVMQGLCITAQAEHYRRMLSTEGIFTRGTLYWQLVRK